MSVAENVNMTTITVKRTNKTTAEVQAEIVQGMAVYLDPDKPDRYRVATRKGRVLLPLTLSTREAQRAISLLVGALPSEVRNGEKSVSAWKSESYAAWKHYDRIVRHIVMSVQLGDWR